MDFVGGYFPFTFLPHLVMLFFCDVLCYVVLYCVMLCSQQPYQQSNFSSKRTSPIRLHVPSSYCNFHTTSADDVVLHQTPCKFEEFGKLSSQRRTQKRTSESSEFARFGSSRQMLRFYCSLQLMGLELVSLYKAEHFTTQPFCAQLSKCQHLSPGQ